MHQLFCLSHYRHVEVNRYYERTGGTRGLLTRDTHCAMASVLSKANNVSLTFSGRFMRRKFETCFIVIQNRMQKQVQ